MTKIVMNRAIKTAYLKAVEAKKAHEALVNELPVDSAGVRAKYKAQKAANKAKYALEQTIERVHHSGLHIEDVYYDFTLLVAYKKKLGTAKLVKKGIFS